MFNKLKEIVYIPYKPYICTSRKAQVTPLLTDAVCQAFPTENIAKAKDKLSTIDKHELKPRIPTSKPGKNIIFLRLG